MTCPLCNDTGEQRYWEGRWRDEAKENERLREALVNALVALENQRAHIKRLVTENAELQDTLMVCRAELERANCPVQERWQGAPHE